MSALNLDPLLRTLGLNKHHASPRWNCYVTSVDDPEITPLVAAGLVREARTPGYLAAISHRVYRATEAGYEAVLVEHRLRHPNPVLTRPRDFVVPRFSDSDAYRALAVKRMIQRTLNLILTGAV